MSPQAPRAGLKSSHDLDRCCNVLNIWCAHTHQSIVGRPRNSTENIYADFLIASDDILQDAPPLAQSWRWRRYDTTDPSINGPLFSQGWMPCNRSLQPSSKFAALFVLLEIRSEATS